jgi:hypothetical protein
MIIGTTVLLHADVIIEAGSETEENGIGENGIAVTGIAVTGIGENGTVISTGSMIPTRSVPIRNGRTNTIGSGSVIGAERLIGSVTGMIVVRRLDVVESGNSGSANGKIGITRPILPRLVQAVRSRFRWTKNRMIPIVTAIPSLDAGAGIVITDCALIANLCPLASHSR